MPKKTTKKITKSKAPRILYRFFDGKNEMGKQSHLHQILRDPKVGWENLSGVSSITKVIAKPLTWWAAGETLKVLGWSNSKLRVNGKYQTVAIETRMATLTPVWKQIRGMDDLAIIKLLDTAYKAHDTRLDESADKGIDLHAECEKYVKLCIEKNKGVPLVITGENEFGFEVPPPKVHEFSIWAHKNIKRFLWSEVYSFDLDLWVGGQSDCGVETLKGEYGVVDFKSHEFPYFSDWVQMAGYHLLIEKNGGYTKEGVRILEPLKKKITKYFLIPFKADNFVANIGVNSEVENMKRSFEAAATLYREMNKFDKY